MNVRSRRILPLLALAVSLLAAAPAFAQQKQVRVGVVNPSRVFGEMQGALNLIWRAPTARMSWRSFLAGMLRARAVSLGLVGAGEGGCLDLTRIPDPSISDGHLSAFDRHLVELV